MKGALTVAVHGQTQRALHLPCKHTHKDIVDNK